MAPERLEKLKTLINTSNILNPEERAEWLALFDLMNDKQLLELENILVTGENKAKNTSAVKTVEQVIEKSKQSAVVITGPSLSPTLTSPPSPVVVEASGFSGQNSDGMNKGNEASRPAGFSADKIPFADSLSSKQLPNLSHIANLSNLKHSPFNLRVATPVVQKPPVLSVKNFPSPLKSDEEKKQNSFADKLKSIFNEKELPVGNRSSELELPSGTATGQKINKNEPDNKVLLAPSLAERKGLEIKPAQVSPPPSFRQTVQPGAVSNFPKAGSVAPQLRPNVAPSASIPKQKDKLQEGILTLIQKHRENNNLPPVERAAAHGGISINLQSLADLASLSASIFEAENLAPIISGIKNLINKYGYHEVIFNIEKSPVYQNYINTGLELLTKQVDFENFKIDSNQNSNSYLSRRQFENVTDLLRQIQAG